MSYKLRSFEVMEKTTGIEGEARFFKEPHCYELMISMSDGRHLVVPMDRMRDLFIYYYVEFVDAKAEKLLVDCGRLG